MGLPNDVNILEDLTEKNEFLNIPSFDTQRKSIEELEDWKDKQMILFNEKMKIKEEQLLKEFNIKWSDDRKRIEEELTHAMSKCKILVENMDEMADTLKEKEATLTARELELVNQRDNVDNKYISLIQNLQTSNAKIINELRCSENTNFLLEKENKQLKEEINTNCSLRIKQLEKTISSLESKCEEANKCCMFYKERWIASVRKINQMYSKLHDTKSNNQVLNNRQKIQNVLTDQIAERQHDEENLRRLLNDLNKVREDMVNTNYFNL